MLSRDSRGREVLAGVATFAAMAYILLVNPAILHEAGMPFGPVMVATALTAGLATLLTGIYAKKPFAMAPYMGENVLFAFTIVPMLIQLGVDPSEAWRVALGAVFWGGVLFLITSLTGARRVLAEAIPMHVAASWAVGIGLFLMFVGFASAGLSLPNVPGAPVKPGSPYKPEALAAIIGTVVALALLVKRVPGAMLAGIAATMITAVALGVNPASGKPIAYPNLLEVAGKLDLIKPWLYPQMWGIILILFLVDLFDTMGTVTGLAVKAGFVDEKGKPIDIDKVFHVDAAATVFGALLGVSTTGTYIESAVGIEEGGRTGLTAVVTGSLFLASLALAPLIAALNPAFLKLASTPALIAVGVLMLSTAKHINLEDPGHVIPFAICLAYMLFTYNIALGIAASLVAYPLVETALGRFKEVHPLAWLLAAFSAVLLVLYPYPA